MQTTTESVLLITIWTLTVTGLFFGLRAKLRKRRSTLAATESTGSQHDQE